jgi:PPK2 family polyphosphate:nucleotide phosphotransferase
MEATMHAAKCFIVRPGKHFKLKDVDPDDTDGVRGKDKAEALVKDNIKLLSDLQYRLYAEHRQSLLIVLQGMDAAGKDGTIRHVMSGLNPQGCNVIPFKTPSAEELSHDYLWRIHRVLPAKGHIGIFNRSHYEDVLAVRVHNLAPKSVWSKRYDQINQFEKMLVEEGTTILKFFLHISSDEQKTRLQDRLIDPSKNWKFTTSDVEERKHWNSYQQAYEDVIRHCSTPWAPWHVIPANYKWFRNVTISTIICDTLKAMDPRIPAPLTDLRRIRIS